MNKQVKRRVRQKFATSTRLIHSVTKQRQRFTALFLFVIILSSVLIASGSPFVIEAQAAKKQQLSALSQAEKPTRKDKLATVDKKISQAAKAAKIDPTKVGKSEIPSRDSSKRIFDPSKSVPNGTNSSVMQLPDGTTAERVSTEVQNVQSGTGWKKLDLKAKPNLDYAAKNKTAQSFLSKILRIGESQPSALDIKGTSLSVQFQTLLDGHGLQISDGQKSITIAPVGANLSKPQQKKAADREFVEYKNVWKDVSLEYDTTADAVKESIVLNSSATNAFTFKITGGELVYNQDGYWQVKDSKIRLAPFSVSLMNQGPVSDAPLKTYYKDGLFSVQLDADWLKKLSKENFPIVIDPQYYARTDVGGDYGRFWNAKSDGYTCGSSNCWMNLGSLWQSGIARHWHTSFHAPYGHISGRQLDAAYMHTGIKYGTSNWIGTEAPKTVWVTWLPAFNYNYGGGAPVVTGTVSSEGWIDVTAIYKWLQARGDYGGWITMWSEENGGSYKLLNPSWTVVDFYYGDYNSRPTAPGVINPANGQVFDDIQPSFQLSPSSDANGDPLKYWFRVMGATTGDCANPTNILIDSGEIDALQWTVPDGILRDGEKYWLCAYVNDHAENTYHYAGGNYWNWTTPVEFRVDRRLGKDPTQTIDDAGPVDVTLSNGNVSMSASSHTMSALGGSIGVGLEYSSPQINRKGLSAKYWNNTTQSGNPVLNRVDGNIEFNWGLGSPSAGVVSIDAFSARWEGYFVAPETGSYQFGGAHDDNFTVTVNQTVMYSGSCCTSGAVGGATMQLSAGQVVPIKVEFAEGGGPGYATLRTQVNGKNMVVHRDWLRTAPLPTYQGNGLTGRYYKLEAGEGFSVPQGRQPFMTRLDSSVNFNWGGGPVISGTPADRFITRWNGHLTVPQDGDYSFCVASDDGMALYIDGVQYSSFWSDRGGQETCGPVQNWRAGQTKPVILDYYENGGGAMVSFQVSYAGRKEVVPTSWLSPGARVVPNGWNLGIDPDGNISYEYLVATSSGVNIFDNTGEKHFFTTIPGSASFKPPVDESAHLIRNNDGSFTLQDNDGRTYEFSQAGLLTRLTTPGDDLRPTALRYEYGGTPSRLQKIVDGVDSSRFMTVHYQGDAACGSKDEAGFADIRSGFDSVPFGMICSVKSTDGEFTNFWYKAGNLARIEVRGRLITDLGYDSLGRIREVRDPVAADAILANIRTNDGGVNTQIEYDAIGRASAVKMPAANAGDSQITRTYEYGAGSFSAWSPPDNLGDKPTGSPNLVEYGEGRLALFARFDSELRWKYFTNGSWSPWQSLGACMTEDPSAVSWEPGRIDVFIRGCDGLLYTKWYVNGVWSNYAGLGSTAMTSSPSATSWAPGRIDIVAKGPSNELLHRAYSITTGWSGFGSLGGCLSNGPTISTWGIDRLNIYLQGCGSPNAFFAKYWQPGWSNFIQFTPEQNISSAFQSVTSPQNRNIQVVGRGASGALRYLRFDGSAWDNWQTVQACIVGVPAITYASDITYLVYKGCDGNLYQTSRTQTRGSTKLHLSGASEPLGYSQKIDYDSIGRTVANTNLAGLTTKTEWDPFKDMSFSTTDPTGLKSTIIYNENDKPIESYGPAPAAWYGSDRRPLAQHVNQVPRTQTNYDEGLVGPAVTWYNYKSGNKVLFGAPRSHSTGYGGAGQAQWLGRDFRSADSASPITPDTSVAGVDGYGFTATGKIKFPDKGTYTFNLWNDDGARLFIDDKQIFSNWGTITEGIAQTRQTGTFSAEAGKSYRFRLDYAHVGNPGGLELWVAGSGITDTNQGLGTSRPSFLIPDYGLTTSTKVFDSQTGDVVNKTNYGSRPELGQITSTVEDTSGLALTTGFTYEPYQSGSLMRQTSKTQPGGNIFNYVHYGGNEKRANPCVANSPEVSQAGRPKGKTEPDPDGSGPVNGRTTETVYDASGQVVATRFNNDPWTCTYYDDRGRITSTTTPGMTIGGVQKAARTINNDYKVNGNPFVTATWDEKGRVETTVDLLGRVTKYIDTQGNVTTSSYDQFGKLTKRESKLGIEDFGYDQFDRPTTYKLDGDTFSTTSYDQFSRVANVQYKAGLSLSSIGRDSLGRENSTTFRLASGQQLTDSVTRSVTGDIINGTENGVSKSYIYDNTNRLTKATIGNNVFEYAFGAQDASCANVVGVNPNAGRNGNRMRQVVNGVATTYCYNGADQLVSSSDERYTAATYDDHGNTTRMGEGAIVTTLSYDANDRNIGIKEVNSSGSIEASYVRDVQNRIVTRTLTTVKNGVVTTTTPESGVGGLLGQTNTTTSPATNTTTSVSNYGFTSSGDSPDFAVDSGGKVTEKYLQLAGDVLVTIRPERTSAGVITYSLPNIHGDVFATVNADGALTGTYMTGPFGETLSGQTSPNNTVNDASWNYVGQHQKLTEATFSSPFTQMGARVYLGSIGRFMQVDPIEGGTDNNYVYVTDPVNDFDLDGTFGFKALGKLAIKAAGGASFVPGPIGMGASAIMVGVALARGDKTGAASAALGMIPGGKIVAKGSVVAKAVMKKSTHVYVGRESGSGAIRYVGITRQKPEVRWGQHLRSNTPKAALNYSLISKSPMSRLNARKMEQFYIDKYKLQKNGGSLYNKINSIRKR